MKRKVFEIKIRRIVEEVYIGYCGDNASRTPDVVRHDATKKSKNSKVNMAIRAAGSGDISVVTHGEHMSEKEAKSLKLQLIKERKSENVPVLNTRGVDNEL